MSITVWEDLPYVLADAEVMAQKLHVGDDDLDAFLPIYKECLRIRKPRFAWREACVDEVSENTVLVEGITFSSRILAVNLRGVDKVIPYVSTCGRELYDYALSRNDPLERFWVDGFSEQVMHLHGLAAMKRLATERGVPRLYAMNPGSLPNWPLSQQRNLFDLLGDVRNTAGVELTQSFLMLPVKSNSGLYFASDEEYVNCEYCARGECPNRRKQFAPSKFAEKYGI